MVLPHHDDATIQNISTSVYIGFRGPRQSGCGIILWREQARI